MKQGIPLRRPAAATAVYIVGNIATKAIAVVSTALFTRIMSPEEFGTYATYISWMGILTVAATLSVGAGPLHRGFLRFRKESDTYLCGALALLFLTWGAVFLLFFALRRALFPRFALGSTMTTLLFLQVLANGIIAFYSARERFQYRAGKVTLLTIVCAAVTAVIGIPLTARAGGSATVRAVTALAVYGSVALFLLLYLFIRFYKAEGRVSFSPVFRYLLSCAVPLFPYAVSISVMAEADKLAVRQWLGAEALGRYSVLFSVGFAPQLLITAVNFALTPWLLRRTGAGEYQRMGEVLALLVRALSVLTLLFLTVAPEVFPLLAPAAYRESLQALYPIALSVLLRFLSGAYATVLLGRGARAAQTAPAMLVAAFSLPLYPLLLPAFGYMAAALLQPLLYAALWGAYLLYLRRRGGVRISHEGDTALTCLFAGMGAWALGQLAAYPFLRLFAFVLLLIPTMLCAREMLGFVREETAPAPCDVPADQAPL